MNRGVRAKFVEPRRYADPEAAARKLIEIASTIESVQNGRINIELVNAPFPAGGNPDEFRAGIERAITKGWLVRHESGIYVRSVRLTGDIRTATIDHFAADPAAYD